jgi:predicted metal-dependent peptidase
MAEKETSLPEEPGKIITKIAEEWFLKEPLIFGVYCTHKLTENRKMKIPFRCGRMRIEYNPELLEKMDGKQIADLLKIEVVRIILKHPYQRMPVCPNFAALALASDITIQDSTIKDSASFFSSPKTKLRSPADFDLPNGLCYEEYYAKLLNKLREQLKDFSLTLMENSEAEDSDAEDSKTVLQNGEAEEDDEESDENGFMASFQTAELWEENDEAAETVNAEIEKAQTSNSWGSISGDLKQIIEASLVIQMDYRRMLSMFRASILSSKRKPTRMKPNRRYGFSYMGSQSDFTTGLLVAVDTSGSISDEALKQFFSIVNRFFKYGIKTIDVIQFDAELKEEVLSLKKAKSKVEITGRGGTDFQPAIDYYEKHKMYDGLIVFTDGYAAIPKLSGYSAKILWVLTSRQEYEDFCAEILDHLPGSKATYIPL